MFGLEGIVCASSQTSVAMPAEYPVTSYNCLEVVQLGQNARSAPIPEGCFYSLLAKGTTAEGLTCFTLSDEPLLP